jgi:maleylpyruvate isomerase
MGFGDLDLTERLLIVRRGTAYFAQRLAELADADLNSHTRLDGWTRKHLVAHVGYNAAALCRLLDWAATGVETPIYASRQQRAQEINECATLNGAVLRNLFDHTVARLDDKWRHPPASAWQAPVRTAQGRLVPAAETAWMRAREVWIHAVDPDTGARFGGFPDVLLDDIVGTWRRNGQGAGLVLRVDGRVGIAVQDNTPVDATIRGPLPAVVRWAAGRGGIALTTGTEKDPPPWL